MNFQQHKDYGIGAAVVTSALYYVYMTSSYYFQSGAFAFSIDLFWYCIAMLLLVFVGSLVPDLDTKSTPSRIVSTFLAIYWGLILFSKEINDYLDLNYTIHWVPAGVLSFIFLICSASKHRGITHALLWVPAVAGLGIYTSDHLLVGFAIGLGTHYYCDSISPLKLKNWV